MRKQIVVGLIVMLGIAALAVSFEVFQQRADDAASASPEVHHEAATASQPYRELSDVSPGEQKIPASLASLQSPEPPTAKAAQASADAAQGAARTAAQIAAHN